MLNPVVLIQSIGIINFVLRAVVAICAAFMLLIVCAGLFFLMGF
jgi:hypothetical protein